jgi:hypothetical protein
MPVSGALGALPPCGAMSPGEPEQAVSTPSTTKADNATANLLEICFMITNLAIACEVQQRPFR